MNDQGSHPRRDNCIGLGVVAVALGVLLGAMPVHGQSQASTSSSNKPAERTITPGTIVPAVLHTPLSLHKCKPGQEVSGTVAQDVPMANGVKIRKGTEIKGHIVEVTANASGTGQRVAMQFDKMHWNGQWIPIVTDLRAFASSVDVMEAHVPDEAPNEGSPYEWLPTTQVGGDSVYGQRGQVMSADEPSQVVGKSVPGGVLVQASAKKGTKCRGDVDGNNGPQALWVFSSGACGVYGVNGLSIVHAGRTNPIGTIILESNADNVKLRDGDGMLLRIH
jgi:hypothetical protein